MDERLYWLDFSAFPGVGTLRFEIVLSHLSTAKLAWEASESELLPVLKPKLTEQFIAFRKTFSLEAYAEKLLKKHVEFVILADDTYPELLKHISNPPFVLYGKGNLSMFHPHLTSPVKKDEPIISLPLDGEGETFIGVVGTRKVTMYGRDVTELLTRELVGAGCVIVSGLAMGVDAVAHKTTIDNGGKTIAVLGCGVDCCSPRENEALYEDIIEHDGAIVSEFPLGMFPSRNRIISGLSHGVLVTEGAEDSGALITAKDALAAGRKVFAVPGPITSSPSK